MDGKKTIKNRLTTGPDRQELLLSKLKMKALRLGFGEIKCTMKVHEGKIVEIRLHFSEETLRAGP